MCSSGSIVPQYQCILSPFQVVGSCSSITPIDKGVATWSSNRPRCVGWCGEHGFTFVFYHFVHHWRKKSSNGFWVMVRYITGWCSTSFFFISSFSCLTIRISSSFVISCWSSPFEGSRGWPLGHLRLLLNRL